jgi:hypothetical protein
MNWLKAKLGIRLNESARRFGAVVLVLSSAGLTIGASGLPPVSSPGSDPESNLQYLHELHRNDPQQYERLVRNYRRFRSLSPQQQEKLRKFDRQLHDEDSATQSRMLRVLGEYSAWLTRLPEADQKRIAGQTTVEDRLKVVRELRELQWLTNLPAAVRVKVAAASQDDRKALIEQLQREQKEQREEWAEMQRLESMARERPVMAMVNQESFRRELQVFIEKRLTPMLSPQEKSLLRLPDGEARRNMVAWLRTVAELAERHPVLALEPKFTRRSELPAEYKKALNELPRGQLDKLSEGKWPDFPVEVTRLHRARNVPLKTQLGPAAAKEFSADMEHFVAALPVGDREKLKAAEGKWPDYPQALHEAARKNKVVLPDIGLPGDPRFWEFLRRRAANPLPVPPEQLLRQFALELNRSDPSGPHLSLQDPHDREIIIRRFLEQNPDWRRRLEAQDKTKTEAKGKKSSN